MTHPPKGPDDEAWINQMLDDLAQAPIEEAPDALMSRVLADAGAMLPAPGGVRVSWWRQFVEGLGGWSAVGGLAAAAATGFVIGIGGIEPATFDDFLSADYDAYYESQDVFSAFGWDLEDG